MKSFILYGSPVKLTNAHKPVTASVKTPKYYVRCKVFNGNIDAALDKAKPMRGETVLNTVPVNS